MLTRVVLPHGARLSIGRLFATSVPRRNVPTSVAVEQSDEDVYREWVMWVKGTATEPLARKEQEAENKPYSTQRAIRKAKLEARKEQIAADIVAQIESLIAKRNAAEAKASLKQERIAANVVAQKAKTSSLKWQKLGELPSRPLSVYTAVHFASAMQPGENIEVAMTRIHSQYKALTAEQRFPYEEKAASNLKVKGLKNALSIKANYKEVTESTPDARSVKKNGMVAKALTSKYKALSPEERAAYADGIRAEAQVNLAEMASTVSKPT